MITSLKENEIFVFGSNLAGRHGKGAAKDALKFGAIYGQGVGLQGQSYGIPTKDEKLKILSLAQIKPYVDSFYEFAKSNPNLIFLVTKIGCGYAGYQPHQIAPLFEKCKDLGNVVLPEEFKL